MPDVYTSKKKEELPEGKESVLTETGKELMAVKTNKKRANHYGPFSAFYYFPAKVDFETREGQEKVVLLLRRHVITNVRWVLIALIMIAAPFFLDLLSPATLLPDNLKLILVLFWYLITTAFILESFFNWFFNVNIVTDERIIDIDFHNLIYKEVSDTKIDKIQDVTYKMGGVVRTIFNYGDVYIQTAAEVPSFEFLAVPNPDRVVRVLQDLIIEEEQEVIEGRVR